MKTKQTIVIIDAATASCEIHETELKLTEKQAIEKFNIGNDSQYLFGKDITIFDRREKSNHNQFVRCLENIQDLSGQGLHEYAIQLNGCFSRKSIYFTKNGRYQIVNHIDDTEQFLTAKQIMDKRYTNIGDAMSKRALIAIIE